MSKYDPLGIYLRSLDGPEIRLTFSEIERILGFDLPMSAMASPSWWSNNPFNNVMTKVWLDAGFKSEQVDIEQGMLVFRRVNETKAKSMGMEEEARMFTLTESKPNISSPREKVTRHPASGAMKGTFWIDPDWDLTKPALDPEELAAWEAKLDRIADEHEARLRNRSSGKESK